MWREPALHICLSLLSLSVTHNPSVSQVCLFECECVCESPSFLSYDRPILDPAGFEPRITGVSKLWPCAA